MNIWNDDIYTFVLKETLIVVHIRQRKDDAPSLDRVKGALSLVYFIDKLCNFALLILATLLSPHPHPLILW